MIRSLLFVPASRPDRFERALESGADAVCLDLEDAVSPAGKAEAREAARAFLATSLGGHSAVGLRINGTDTPWWADDLAAGALASFVMVPKAASAAALTPVSARLREGCGLWPLVETAEGLMRAWEIAAAGGVAGVLFGAFDYAADVGCDVAWEPLLFARSRLAAACARSRVACLDAPFGDLHDAVGLESSTRRARALGFTGRACIHPLQVEIVNAAFTPSETELAEARRVLEAFDAGMGGAGRSNGEFIDLPVALAARRVIARAGG